MKFIVIGAGAWGCAMAVHLRRVGHEVTVVCRDEAMREELTRAHENKERLPEINLSGIEFVAEAPEKCDVAVVALPSHVYKEVLGAAKLQAPVWISLAKGFIVERLETPCEMLEEIFPKETTVMCLNGPTHAGTVAEGKPCAMVLAGKKKGERREEKGDKCEKIMGELQEAISSPVMRIYTSGDRRGAELGGALKNAFAVAAGICDGLKLGDNAKAALLTRALAEMVRLGVALGGKQETFFGLTGVGDLMATSYGAWSRNRQFGERIALGETAEKLATELTAEGYRASKGLLELAHKKGVEAPILEQVVAVLYAGKDPREAMAELMGRKLKREY